VELDNAVKTRSTAGFWIALAILAAVFCLYVAFKPWRPTMSATKHPAVGRQLPALELQPLTAGATAVTLTELRGKVVLLNFWGTCCPPCRAEFPHLVALSRELKSYSNFRLLPVSCGEERDDTLDELAQDTKQFLAAQKAELDCYADQNAFTRRSVVMAIDERGFVYPTTLALDQTGVIRGVWQGYAPGAELEMKQIVDELLAASPPATK
jgi:thiol-disulfide isomerase/thioredoxin